MAIPRGIFDVSAVAQGWLDDTGQEDGWFDPELLDVVTPPPAGGPVGAMMMLRVGGG